MGTAETEPEVRVDEDGTIHCRLRVRLSTDIHSERHARLFLSNSVRLHRALRNAGVDAERHVWEAAPHGGFDLTGAPEEAEARAEQARFLAKHWGIGSGGRTTTTTSCPHPLIGTHRVRKGTT